MNRAGAEALLLALVLGSALAAGCAGLAPAVPGVGAESPSPGGAGEAQQFLPVAYLSRDEKEVQKAPEGQLGSPRKETLSAPKAVSIARNAPALAPPFADTTELTAETLVREVVARNPTLAQMVAAWQAAAARYPQVTALDDPMFAATVGPGTIAPDDSGVEFAYRLEISQKLPFPGKLKLRGERALAEASAAGRDVDDTRLQLVESAQTAFYDYYLVERALEVNQESLRLLRTFRKNAQTRYETGLVPQQDLLQADVEIGKEWDRRLELEQMRQVAIARINTLLHLPPDSPVPPPTKQLDVPQGLPDAQLLRATALARRPDLQALADRIAAEEASLRLAHKDWYPDFEPFFMYDRFMGNTTDNRDLSTMLGVRLNLPVYHGRRNGAIAEAEARLAQRKAELARLTDQVNFQVQEAYARAQRSARSVALYRKTILRAAQANVEAAQAAYTTGKVPFVSLIEAQRNVVNLRDRYYEALADSFRRRAALERAVGGPLVELVKLSDRRSLARGFPGR
jgi:outer membrane protein TolC